jgi:ribosomal protein S19E (S16A)
MTYQDKNGNVTVNGKALTKKGTTDMDRIASQLVAKNRKGKKE